MKKYVVLFLVVVGLALSLGSCKSTETCPAYGKVEVSSTQG